MTAWKGAERYADRRPFLLARAKILAAIRGWFAEQGFVETDLGAIVPVPGAETHIAAFAVEGGYLHVSPEFAMKQVLAAGARKIYRLGHVYRRGETGPLHAPEFTMLEWYRANETYEAVIADALAFVRLAAETTGATAFAFRDRVCDPRAEAERLSVADALTYHAGIDLLATLSDTGEGDRDILATKATCS